MVGKVKFDIMIEEETGTIGRPWLAMLTDSIKP